MMAHFLFRLLECLLAGVCSWGLIDEKIPSKSQIQGSKAPAVMQENQAKYSVGIGIFEEGGLVNMDIQSIKIDLIHWLTQLQDRTVLEKIQAIKEEEVHELSPDQQKELNERLERYERGDSKFKTWEETKKSIRNTK